MLADEHYLHFYGEYIGDDRDEFFDELTSTWDVDKVETSFQSRRGGRLVREGQDDFYELWFFSQLSSVEDATSADCARLLRIMRGLPRSPLIPCNTVDGIVGCDMNAFKAYMKAVFECDVDEDDEGFIFDGHFAVDDTTALLTALLTRTQALTGFGESHLGKRFFLYAPACVPSFVLKAGENDENINRKLNDAITCSVCLNIMREPASLSCGHSGCIGCLQSAGLKCPLCKKRRRADEDLQVNIALRDTINIACPGR